jgi:hypothetical protein
MPLIGTNHPVRIEKGVGHVCEVKAPMLKALAAFGFIPFKIHRTYCRPMNYFGESMAPAWCSPWAATRMNPAESLFEHGLACHGTCFCQSPSLSKFANRTSIRQQ